MRIQSADTNPEAEAVLISMLRQAKPCQKFGQVRSLSQTMLSLSRRAISRKNGHLSDAELRVLFIRYQYGDELADRFEEYLKTRGHERS